MNFNSAKPFHEHALAAPERPALFVEDKTYSYGELHAFVQPVAAWLRKEGRGRVERVGILASRTLETYRGILGAGWAGAAYVPLSTRLPEDRLVQIFERVDLDALVVDANGLPQLTDRVLSVCPPLILAPGQAQSIERPADCGRRLQIAGHDALPPFDAADKPEVVGPESLAYIEFTSGTTGIPKGVMISTGALEHYVRVMRSRYAIGKEDSSAAAAEITFDISVSDMFLTWASGAQLMVIPATQTMAPLAFFRKMRPTVWFSVPSSIGFMHRLKMLAPGSLDSIRFSFFSGETLPGASAALWQQAASNSIVDNLYGPTEATVVCTWRRYTGPDSLTPGRGVVSIGKPFDGMKAAIFGSALEELPRSEHGEIALSGPQLSSGYFRDAEQTNLRYRMVRGERWYLTGDLGYEDEQGNLHHLGRLDNQVKIRGLRVELEEIDTHLRDICGTDSVVTIAWPIENGMAKDIVAFVAASRVEDESAVTTQLSKRLAPYMMPGEIHFMDALPLSPNGKVNRKELHRLLAEQAK
jgi:amino acid adenylation domain-containing protein